MQEADDLWGSSKMQAIVPTVQTAENLGSFARETAPSSLNEDRSRSQETPADLTSTSSTRDDAERKNTQGLKMKTEISRSTVKRSRFFQRLRKKRAMNTWQWKSGQIALLALVAVVNMSINAVPPILYFTIEVSVRVHIHTDLYECICIQFILCEL